MNYFDPEKLNQPSKEQRPKSLINLFDKLKNYFFQNIEEYDKRIGVLREIKERLKNSKDIQGLKDKLSQENLDLLVNRILTYGSLPWHVFILSTPQEGLREIFDVEKFDEIDFNKLVGYFKTDIQNKISNIQPDALSFINEDYLKNLNLDILRTVLKVIIKDIIENIKRIKSLPQIDLNSLLESASEEGKIILESIKSCFNEDFLKKTIEEINP